MDEQARLSDKMNEELLQKELDKRIALMREGGPDGGVTDQARVFDHIVEQFEQGKYMRLMVQASAGTDTAGAQKLRNTVLVIKPP